MFLGADVFQCRFLEAARTVGVEPDEDQEAARLSMDAQESLFRYTVASWIELVPFLVGGYEEVLRDLPAGETFGGDLVAAPSIMAPIAALSPSSSLALSAATPPPTTPASSQLSAPLQSRDLQLVLPLMVPRLPLQGLLSGSFVGFPVAAARRPLRVPRRCTSAA